MRTNARKTTADPLRSWDVCEWDTQAPEVFPNTAVKGRRLVKDYRKELIAEAALTRIGKRIVVLGRGYQRFLEKYISRVEGYQPNNSSEHWRTGGAQSANAES